MAVRRGKEPFSDAGRGGTVQGAASGRETHIWQVSIRRRGEGKGGKKEHLGGESALCKSVVVYIQ